MTVEANRESKCFQCNRMIQVGNRIEFIKGSRRDGSEVYRPVHEACYPPQPSTPPAVPSGGQVERPAPPVASPVPIGPEQVSVSGGTTLYVEVGGWVPAEYAHEVVAAIVTAKLKKPAVKP